MGASGVASLALGLACGKVGSSSASGASGATEAGAERGACFPNGTCYAGLVCISELCVNPNAASDAGPGGGGGGVGGPVVTVDGGTCGAIPVLTSGCWAEGHNACEDGTCVDFVEAGCPPIIDFSGGWPLQCGATADCMNGGVCCAGTDFALLQAVPGNPCVVDTSSTSMGSDFYGRATRCSTMGCKSPVCKSDADCTPGRHCAVLQLTEDPKGPGVGACIL